MLTHPTFFRQRISVDPPSKSNYSGKQIEDMQNVALHEGRKLIPSTCTLHPECIIGPKIDVRIALFDLMKFKASNGFSFWAMGDAWEPPIELQSNFRE